MSGSLVMNQYEKSVERIFKKKKEKEQEKKIVLTISWAEQSAAIHAVLAWSAYCWFHA